MHIIAISYVEYISWVHGGGFFKPHTLWREWISIGGLADKVYIKGEVMCFSSVYIYKETFQVKVDV